MVPESVAAARHAADQPPDFARFHSECMIS